MSLTQTQIKAAAHTLWQTALGSGGIGALVEAVTGPTINLSGVEQGGIVAGMAVAGSALSLLKSAAVNYAASHKQSRTVKDAQRIAQLAQQVEAYSAAHPTPPHSA